MISNLYQDARALCVCIIAISLWFYFFLLFHNNFALFFSGYVYYNESEREREKENEKESERFMKASLLAMYDSFLFDGAQISNL